MELSLLLLDDPYHDVLMQVYSQVINARKSASWIINIFYLQPTPVPLHFVKESQDTTPSDYPFKSTGLAIPIGHIAAQKLNVS